MPRAHRLLSLLALVLLSANSSSAQVATGTPPFGSFTGSPDVVDLANLNVHITIPVFNRAGRGTPFTYNLAYDTSIWTPTSVSGTTTWTPAQNFGFLGQTEVSTGELSAEYQGLVCQVYIYLNHRWVTTGFQFTYFNWVYIDAQGIQHPFNAGSSGGWGSCNGTGVTAHDLTNVVAPDGSGYVISTKQLPTNQTDNAWVTTTNGTVTYPPINATSGSATYTDRNGNQVSINASGTFTDTLGTTALTVSGSGTPTSPVKFAYTPPSGTAVNYQVNYTSYTVATNFGISTIHEFGATAEPLVSSIVLPDGSQYTFNYEATPSAPSSGVCTPLSGTYLTNCVTARLASITLPTGGSITYTYTGVNNGILSDGSTAGLQRVLTDGGSWSATWNYSHTQITGTHWQTTISDPTTPTANQTVIDFQGLYETNRATYQGSSSSGTLLQTVTTCYNGAASPCTTTPITAAITRRTLLVEYPNSSGKVCEHDQYFNAYGLQTEQDDYDYGTGAPASTPLRKAITVYNTALTNGIVDMPSSITMCNGSGTSSACTGPSGSSTGTVVAQTTYAYDETTPTTSSPVSPQWTSITGSRGNATTIKSLVQGSTFLTQTNTYYDTGNPNIVTHVNGGTTTYSYTGTSCGNAFPTGLTEAISTLTQSYTWNCAGGVQLSAADENSQATSTTFSDPYFWRPASTNDQQNNSTAFYYATNSPMWIAQELFFNSNQSLADTNTGYDGLGRLIVTNHAQTPSQTAFDQVLQSFDSNGRPWKTSAPCVTTGAWTCPITAKTTSYDALNRITQVIDGGGGTIANTYTQNDVLVAVGPAASGENTKRRQLEYDALGRLISVCELTTLSGSGTCGQTTTQTGYWTKYTYDALGDLLTVTQNAQATSANQQTRTYTYDAMGRLTSETNPESGTKSYVFDSDSTMCGNGAYTSKGDLVKTVDAVGNCVMRYYDALHRVTDVGDVQHCRRFRYDNTNGVLGTIPSGVTVSNKLGHLVEAETDTCAAPITQSSIITDEWFSYTARGETSDVYESTPHSGAYYHSASTYWANGALNQLNSYYGSTPNYSAAWNVDGEGRPYSVYPVTGTAYNAASQPTQVNFTWGDSDSYSYDPNTNRMTQYQFTVNGQSNKGVLTWNPNGTLGQLAITDPFNSADTQTCNYSHDDLVRIVSANCGSAAAQTFSYDPFGNLNKFGSPYGFQPTYSTSTNRMTSLGTFTPTYDNNGNLLSDNMHNYAWDADGNSVSLDGVAITFDALDRMVEQNRSGAYTQFVYSPTGFKMQILNGQTVARNFVPLAGGGTAVYNTSALQDIRHPDQLGSSRFASTPSRTVYYDGAYAPFGEPYAQSGNTDLSFTGMNSDTTSGVYDFLYREYSMQGRWPSPDPAGLAAVDPTNPQSWNRYAYVLNGPLNSVDALGLVSGNSLPRCFETPDGGEVCVTLSGSGGVNIYPCFGFAGYAAGGCPAPPPIMSATPTGPACVRADRTIQKIGMATQEAVAEFTGSSVGVGAGGTISFGNKLGVTLSASRQLVVSPDGQAAFVTTVTPISPTGINSYVSPGIGGYGGIQVSFSNAQGPNELSGTSIDFGGGGGRGLGAGGDLSVGWSDNGPVVQGTVTIGAGGGVPGITGHGVTPLYTFVTPICRE